MAFAREAEYRANLALTAVEAVLQMAFVVLTVLLLFQRGGEIAGWTQAEVLMLAGVYRAIGGLIALQIAPNMQAVSELIRKGDLDALLLRPAPSQLLVSIRTLALPEAVNVLIGLALAGYAAGQAGVALTADRVALAAGFALCGLLLLYAFWLATVTLSFWLVQVDTLDLLFYGAFEAARYPVSFFKGIGRMLLTYVIPVAFATTFPTEALLGRADSGMLAIGAGLAVAGLAASSWFWRFALRHYSSASS
jgi:ABC-2 type transport system permease protein